MVSTHTRVFVACASAQGLMAFTAGTVGYANICSGEILGSFWAASCFAFSNPLTAQVAYCVFCLQKAVLACKFCISAQAGCGQKVVCKYKAAILTIYLDLGRRRRGRRAGWLRRGRRRNPVRELAGGRYRGGRQLVDIITLNVISARSCQATCITCITGAKTRILPLKSLRARPQSVRKEPWSLGEGPRSPGADQRSEEGRAP